MEEEKPVFLYDANNGNYSYGTISIQDKNNHVSGTDIRSFGESGIIENNLLQENIIVNFQSEDEKEQILSIIPKGFYAKVNGNNIIIEFEKEEITAPVYVNEYHDGGYYRRSQSHYSCKKKEDKTLQVTLKTPELSKRILDFNASLYKIKSSIYPELYNDKYDASRSKSAYLVWLIQTGQAEIIRGRNNIYIYDPWSKTHSSDTSILTPEECLAGLQSGRDSYSFTCKFQNQTYDVSISDADSYTYTEDFGGLEKLFEQYVSELKESGEYYLPGTEIPRFRAPKVGTKIIKIDEDKYIVANRAQIYSQLSGTPIFNDSFILTNDNSIVYGSGEQEKFLDMMHTKFKGSDHIETETFMGYNDNQIMFIHDKRKSYDRRTVSENAIQRFDREDSEHPVSMFSVGDTIGFVDGSKVRLSDEKGKLSTFEIEEEIQSIEVQNGYVLINGSILCCGARYKGKSWSRDEKIAPFCKKISNPKRIEVFMQESNSIQQSSFIENENGCFFTEGLTEEEKLRLYQENGFSELYEKLESTIIARQEAQKEEERRIEEAKNKTNEYLEGKVLSLCHLRKRSSRRGEIIEADNVEFVENDDAVVLYEKEEKGWGYGPVYDTGIIYVPEAKKRTKGGKLHLDVPEDLMGMIIGRQGANINSVTAILKEKGIDLSRIILHPKSREEIKITIDSIEKAIKEQRAQSHEE